MGLVVFHFSPDLPHHLELYVAAAGGRSRRRRRGTSVAHINAPHAASAGRSRQKLHHEAARLPGCIKCTNNAAPLQLPARGPHLAGRGPALPSPPQGAAARRRRRLVLAAPFLRASAAASEGWPVAPARGRLGSVGCRARRRSGGEPATAGGPTGGPRARRISGLPPPTCSLTGAHALQQGAPGSLQGAPHAISRWSPPTAVQGPLHRCVRAAAGSRRG